MDVFDCPFLSSVSLCLLQEKLPVEVAAHALRSIISVGNLCPSRSLSLLLGVYEDFLWSRNQLLPLVRLFSKYKVREVVGFVLHLYADAHKHNKQQLLQQPPLQPWGTSSSSSSSRRGDSPGLVRAAGDTLQVSLSCLRFLSLHIPISAVGRKRHAVSPIIIISTCICIYWEYWVCAAADSRVRDGGLAHEDHPQHC